MSRLGTLTEENLSDAQRKLREAMIQGPRGMAAAAGGPFEVWLHSPAFGHRVQEFGAYMRYGTSLSPRVSELAILTCARHWDAAYEWAAHVGHAASAGVPMSTIAALRENRELRFEDDTDAAVYAFCGELLQQRRVTDSSYARLGTLLGTSALVELVGLLGYYSLVALTLNAFEVEPPERGTESPATAGTKPPAAAGA